MLQTGRRPVLRCARVGGPVGPIVADVERPRSTLYDLSRDDDLFHPFEVRQVEHGIEQDALYNRTQAARTRFAVDRLTGNGAERFVRQREIHTIHLEQPLILLHQRILGLGEESA